MVTIIVFSINSNCTNNCNNNNNNINHSVNMFVVNSEVKYVLKDNIISIRVNSVWQIRVMKIQSAVETRCSGLRILY
jgi:hypothetical protein